MNKVGWLVESSSYICRAFNGQKCLRLLVLWPRFMARAYEWVVWGQWNVLPSLEEVGWGDFSSPPPGIWGIRKKERKIQFIYSEKATKFCKSSTVDLSYVVPVTFTLEISQNIWTLNHLLAKSEVQFALWLEQKIGRPLWTLLTDLKRFRQPWTLIPSTSEFYAFICSHCPAKVFLFFLATLARIYLFNSNFCSLSKGPSEIRRKTGLRDLMVS